MSAFVNRLISPRLNRGHKDRRRVGGFTIVELMVVIGIITVLLGLLFPTLSTIRTTGRQTVELNAAKHLMIAYINYAGAHNDKVMPGYTGQIPVDPAPNTNVRILRAYDAAGKAITGSGTPPLDVARKRYLWRLAPYLGYNIKGLYTNEQEILLERMEQQDYNTYLYLASLSPALGINSEWIGGDEEYGFRPVGHIYRTVIDYNKFYLTSLTQAIHPERLMVFGSARGVDPNSEGHPVEGYFKIRSPYFAQINPACRWSIEFNVRDDPVMFGYVSPRYIGKAVAGFIDGHADLLTTEQVRDMRHWANWATHETWTVPSPPPPQPQ